MKLTQFWLACLLTTSSLAAQGSSRSDVDLQKAIQKENVDGDLRGAIEIYRRLASRTAEPAIAAQALLHLAECHEKQGSAESRKAYEELVRRFPDRQEANVARQRIGGVSQSKPALVVRKIWDGARFGNTGTTSRDGRYLSFTRWIPNAELGVLDTLTGQNWDLTKRPGPEYTMAMSGIFSPDATELVYSWMNPDGTSELRITPRAGGSHRILLKPSNGGFTTPFAWSNDKKRILALISKPTNRLVWISVSDASVTDITTMGPCCTPQAGNAVLSPDGRYIAFDRKKANNPNDQDVFVISASGGAEVPVMEESKREIVLGWSPDSANLLIGSYRTGPMGAWLVPMKDGSPAASPYLVKDNIGDIYPMGFDTKGTFYYNINPGANHQVFSAQLDPASGRITSPQLANAQHLVGSWRPVYSPDGKSLALTRMSRLAGTIPSAAVVIDLATGAETIAEVPKTPLFHWRADSSLIAPGPTGYLLVPLDGNKPSPIDLKQNPAGKDCNGNRVVQSQGKYTNLDTGAEVQVPNIPSTIRTRLSTSCAAAAWAKDGVLWVSNIGHGSSPRELLRLPQGEFFQDNVTDLIWSPDDRFIYFVTYRDRYSDYELWRIPSAGGKPVSTGIKLPDIKQLTIHPDGNRIAFNSVRWSYEAWAIENLLARRN